MNTSRLFSSLNENTSIAAVAQSATINPGPAPYSKTRLQRALDSTSKSRSQRVKAPYRLSLLDASGRQTS